MITLGLRKHRTDTSDRTPPGQYVTVDFLGYRRDLLQTMAVPLSPSPGLHSP
jgi:hypothetical protein